MKKALSLLLILSLSVTMSIGVMSVSVFAEDNPNTPVMVKITKGDVTQDINLSELDLDEYSYSSINNAATVEIVKVKGVKLSTLLSLAGITADENDAIKLVCGGSKPGDVVWNYSDLFGKKYRYKDIAKMNADKGPVNTKYDSKTRVYPVIALEEDDDMVLNARFYFGQAYATDRNAPRFFDHIEAIEVVSKIDKETLPKPVFATNSTVAVGTVLDFEEAETCNYVYYTVNGKNPTVTNSRIYNYGPKAKPALFNKYTFKKAGYVTVKAVMKGYNNKNKAYFKDSKVVTRKYTVKPAKAKVTKIVAGKKSATVSIKSQKNSGVTGYKVYYQKVGSTKWNSVKTTKTSYKLTKLKKGVSYNIKVRAYAKVKSGKTTKTLYGAYSDVKVVTVK